MKFTACLAILGATASLASAFVNPKEPWGQSSWKPGTQVNITWDEDGVEPKLSSNPVVDIFLNTGADQTNVKIATIATGIEVGKTNSYLYTVPNVSPPGKIYFLTFVATNGPGMAWSTRFTITDAAGEAGTLAPSAPVGSNPGAIGATVTAPVYLNSPTAVVPAPSATTTAPVSGVGAGTNPSSPAGANPTPSNKPSSAVSLSTSVLTAAAAFVVSAAALVL
ncbi:hypothetical protein BX616_009728 [Lobosporangium transversale]|uniref:Yeast cell wall synthesis Kre9/Knh1-like N-terminal domain-containing protein n=1 Tax=Lobosporangium transversale TaxID=64571 RepID=A0A1Y2H0T8_9FUNG|nr:hypothetical protein BCR41DRAFT_418275 [Lobosporangium transversale]KAF9918265.1 hypothetical protein BX616_009728 [Lobosporangium transversale]ORZ28170.1 hypothetical protein BCR41DRAFT_418275 [Lobosporangium transversale]|eukprot:XP_021885855.1 hypothetical protein BCR41DRAFT_418275 [Lobosporangium transversale]